MNEKHEEAKYGKKQAMPLASHHGNPGLCPGSMWDLW
jgi:hypothetical protein